MVNIEKTKRLIKEMRTEMNDFSSRFTEERRKSHGLKQEGEGESEENMNISHISIESLVGKEGSKN
jgi:hypothetical protein